MDQKPVPYDIHDSKENLEIKIGDPYSTITGAHQFIITYEVVGNYAYFDDGTAEIYWDVTGTQWNVPIQKVTALIHTADIPLLERVACYKGPEGSNTPCDSIQTEDTGSVHFFASNLAPYENLTIAQSFDAAPVEKVILERYRWIIFAVIFFPVLILAMIFFGYRYRTQYKTGNPIVAQYEPFEDFKPMYAGMLFDGRLDPRDITAGIVYLAEQGYLKIRRIERKVLFVFEVDDYEITLMRSVASIPNDFLRDIVLLMFELHDTAGRIVSLDELKQKSIKQRENFTRLQKLKRDLKEDMKNNGFYQTFPVIGYLVGSIAILFFILILLVEIYPLLTIFGVCVLLAVAGIFAFVMSERRTRRGYEALDHLKGFKLFLSVTDEERFKFHNAPQKSPEQFMEYLPFAIAFGVEKQWAKAFEDITIPNPDWYDGGSVGSFSAMNFTSSIGAFSSSIASSSVSSSSSSGGSSGGGFSGGGGGGGGGGSW